MKSIRKLSSLIILLIIISSCSRPDAPVFRGIREVKLVEKANNQVEMTAFADFYNPNNYKITLKQADINVLLNDKKIKNFKQDFDLKIDKNSDFTVPLNATFSQNDINKNLITSALNILLGRKLLITYEGNIRLKKLGIGIKVPIKGESEIDPKSF